MKRVEAACIFQTLVFKQKEELGLSKEAASVINHEELEKYKAGLEKTNTRYQITEQTDMADGSVLVRVRKQYNDRTDVSEYFA